MDLFDDEVEQTTSRDEQKDELKISADYAKKFEERKRKQDLKKAMEVLDSDSDMSSEDSDAELLTDQVQSKILDTLVKIKKKDPSIYDDSKTFFGDDDFAIAEKEKKEKRVEYKDMLRSALLEGGADAFGEDEEQFQQKAKKMTPLEEQAELKRAFLAAAEDGEDDDDLFVKKEKGASEVAAEQADFDEWAKSHKVGDGDDALLKHYYQEDENLTEKDKFLRDYLQNKRWMEAESLQKPEESESDDSEEEGDKADLFEANYNFRFEEEGGAQIVGYDRNQKDSVRVNEKKNARKKAREARKERKADEKVRQLEELKRLKNLKKEEIQRRMQLINEVTGNEEMPFGIDIDGDFNPESHDGLVHQILGDDYESKADPKRPVAPDTGDDTFKDDHEWADDEEWDAGAEDEAEAPAEDEAYAPVKDESWEDTGDSAWAEAAEESAEPNGAGWADADADAQPGAEPDWWLCDGCFKGIPGGKKRFDCTVCADFTLCVRCFRHRGHRHRMQKKTVPVNKMPPVEYKDKVFIPDKDKEKVELGEYMDEYFQMDYEDMIGDLPTRFKYRSVLPSSQGFTIDEILKTDDKELNRRFSIKKLAPYRNDNGKRPREPETEAANQKYAKQSAWHDKQEKKKEGKGKGKGQKEFVPKAPKAAQVDKDRLAAYGMAPSLPAKKKDGKKKKKTAKAAAQSA